MNEGKKGKNIVSTILILLACVLVFIGLWTLLQGDSDEIYFHTTFKQEFVAGEYYSVYVSGYVVRVVYKGSDNAQSQSDASRYYDNSFVAPSREAIVDFINDNLNQNNADTIVKYADPNALTFASFMPFIWVLVLVGLGFFFIRQINRQNAQNVDFGRSQARLIKNIKIRFSDVAGAEEEKEELREIVDFLKQPKRFVDVGARIPKGVLLVGPPGTGKTLFAKAVAGEAGVPFFSLSGSDFVEMFVGVGASRVRDVFAQAKQNMPSIIFIDEIDAVGRHRGAGLGGGHDEREQTLNQLLVEMDGFETNTSVIVMAATNREDILDPALMRPGRFDRRVYVNYPDVRGREAILKVHSRGKPLGNDVDFKIIARITQGFTGADLENLLNEAAILAVRAGRSVITMADLNESIEKVAMGPQKRSRVVTESDKRITAYHEAGHAILAESLKYCDAVHAVTIIPRGNAAGYTLTRPENDNNHVNKAKLIDTITMTLGGRVAEELIIQNITSGASGDIRQVTSIANRMVTEWGMSENLGPIFYGSEGEVFIGRSYQQQKSFSEETSKQIDAEVHSIVESCHRRATEILSEKISVLHNMARVLFEKETIDHEEVVMLMEGKSVQEVCEHVEKRIAEIEAKRKNEANQKTIATVEPLNEVNTSENSEN